MHKAQAEASRILEKREGAEKQGFCPVPDEPTPAGGGSGAGRAFSVQRYGMLCWGDLFTAAAEGGALTVLAQSLAIPQSTTGLPHVRGLSLSGVVDRNVSLATWRPQADQEKVEHLFARQALPMAWGLSARRFH